MNVADLKEFLEGLPPEMDVFVPEGDWACPLQPQVRKVYLRGPGVFNILQDGEDVPLADQKNAVIIY